MCRISELDKWEEATLLWVTRNAMVHDEKRIGTSADWSHDVCENGQRGHQSPTRSAADADETVAATHAKTNDTVRKKLSGIFLLRPACLTQRTPPPSVLGSAHSLLICINDCRCSGRRVLLRA